VNKRCDVVIIGAGIIGLSLALELRDQNVSVAVLERGEPGREASWAAGGMLTARHPHMHPELQAMALWSAELYPGFTRYIEELSDMNAGFTACGSLHISQEPIPEWSDIEISADQALELEPALVVSSGHIYYLDEAAVDPRMILPALLAACRKRQVEVHHEHAVTSLLRHNGVIRGVKTNVGEFAAEIVVNCAGAWANEFDGAPVQPVKGQMLSVLPQHKPAIHRILKSGEIYLVPRSDGRVTIGATIEHAGYDKRVDPAVIQRQHQLAADLVPALGRARITEAWAGLRPGTPDQLPIMGVSDTPGYFLNTGHYRDGILLAPASARLMTQLITGAELDLDLDAFSPARLS
jgi:glycine oxidase